MSVIRLEIPYNQFVELCMAVPLGSGNPADFYNFSNVVHTGGGGPVIVEFKTKDESFNFSMKYM